MRNRLEILFQKEVRGPGLYHGLRVVACDVKYHKSSGWRPHSRSCQRWGKKQFCDSEDLEREARN